MQINSLVAQSGLFLAIYDGHSSSGVNSGATVSQFLASSLHHIFEASLAAVHDLVKALQLAFCSAERAISVFDCPNAGSTATVAVLSSKSITVAHCGDSRALLVRSGKVIALTEDHRPARPDERERILAAGGQILWNEGERVMGILATTRAFGDSDLKQFGVTAEPEITTVPRCPGDELLILVSDGVTNVLSNDEIGDVASRVVRRAVERGASRAAAVRMAASALGRFSRDRNSKDDITAIVVDLTQDAPATADGEQREQQHGGAQAGGQQQPQPMQQPSEALVQQVQSPPRQCEQQQLQTRPAAAAPPPPTPPQEQQQQQQPEVPRAYGAPGAANACLPAGTQSAVGPPSLVGPRPPAPMVHPPAPTAHQPLVCAPLLVPSCGAEHAGAFPCSPAAPPAAWPPSHSAHVGGSLLLRTWPTPPHPAVSAAAAAPPSPPPLLLPLQPATPARQRHCSSGALPVSPGAAAGVPAWNLQPPADISGWPPRRGAELPPALQLGPTPAAHGEAATAASPFLAFAASGFAHGSPPEPHGRCGRGASRGGAPASPDGRSEPEPECPSLFPLPSPLAKRAGPELQPPCRGNRADSPCTAPAASALKARSASCPEPCDAAAAGGAAAALALAAASEAQGGDDDDGRSSAPAAMRGAGLREWAASVLVAGHSARSLSETAAGVPEQR